MSIIDTAHQCTLCQSATVPKRYLRVAKAQPGYTYPTPVFAWFCPYCDFGESNDEESTA